jgi:hypothetical protein
MPLPYTHDTYSPKQVSMGLLPIRGPSVLFSIEPTADASRIA